MISKICNVIAKLKVSLDSFFPSCIPVVKICVMFCAALFFLPGAWVRILNFVMSVPVLDFIHFAPILRLF